MNPCDNTISYSAKKYSFTNDAEGNLIISKK